MARGRDADQAYKAAVAALGKGLTRRAGSRCELCGPDGVDLRVVEVPPTGEEPSEEAAILACARCRALMERGRAPAEAADLRFLEAVAWSDVAPVQIAAVRLLVALREAGHAWATDCLDGLWIADEVRERLGAEAP